LRLLRVVQERMRTLRESLANHDVLKTAVSKASVVETRRKMIAVARNIDIVTNYDGRLHTCRDGRIQRDRSSSQKIAGSAISHKDSTFRGTKHAKNKMQTGAQNGDAESVQHEDRLPSKHIVDDTAQIFGSNDVHIDAPHNAKNRWTTARKSYQPTYDDAANYPTSRSMRVRSRKPPTSTTHDDAMNRPTDKPKSRENRTNVPGPNVANNTMHPNCNASPNKTNAHSGAQHQRSPRSAAEAMHITEQEEAITTAIIRNNDKAEVHGNGPNPTCQNDANNSAVSNNYAVSNNGSADVHARYQHNLGATKYERRHDVNAKIHDDVDDSARSWSKNRNNGNTAAKICARSNSNKHALSNGGAVWNKDNATNGPQHDKLLSRTMTDASYCANDSRLSYANSAKCMYAEPMHRRLASNCYLAKDTYRNWTRHDSHCMQPYLFRAAGKDTPPTRRMYIHPQHIIDTRHSFRGQQHARGILGPYPEQWVGYEMACGNTEIAGWPYGRQYCNTRYGGYTRPYFG
jgi:hypothetical protein